MNRNRLHHTVKRRLEPLSNIFFAMRRQVFAHVSKMTEAERARLLSDFSRLTSTNCGWELSRMKEHVEDVVAFYRERDATIEHLEALRTDYESAEDHYVRMDLMKSIEASERALEAMDEVYQ